MRRDNWFHYKLLIIVWYATSNNSSNNEDHSISRSNNDMMMINSKNDNLPGRDQLIIQGNHYFENQSSLIIFAVQ